MREKPTERCKLASNNDPRNSPRELKLSTFRKPMSTDDFNR
jgi:hypothetical protein